MLQVDLTWISQDKSVQCNIDSDDNADVVHKVKPSKHIVEEEEYVMEEEDFIYSEEEPE